MTMKKYLLAIVVGIFLAAAMGFILVNANIFAFTVIGFGLSSSYQMGLIYAFYPFFITIALFWVYLDGKIEEVSGVEE